MNRLLFVACLLVGGHPTFADELIDPTRPDKAVIQAANGDDLTAPGGTTLALTAIFVSQQGKQAIINGKGFEEGQMVLDYKVISIDQDKVVLGNAQGKQTLFVNNNNIKKDTNNGF